MDCISKALSHLVTRNRCFSFLLVGDRHTILIAVYSAVCYCTVHITVEYAAVLYSTQYCTVHCSAVQTWDYRDSSMLDWECVRLLYIINTQSHNPLCCGQLWLFAQPLIITNHCFNTYSVL